MSKEIFKFLSENAYFSVIIVFFGRIFTPDKPSLYMLANQPTQLHMQFLGGSKERLNLQLSQGPGGVWCQTLHGQSEARSRVT